MSYVNPRLRPQFESLSQGLQDAILERDVRIETLQDLIGVLDALVKESEA